LRFGPNQTGWIARISASQLSLKINASVNAPSQSAPIFEKYTAQLPKTLPAALKIRLWPIPHSHGCIRLHPSAAPKFFALVHQGTPVDIAQSQPEDQTIGKNVTRPADYKYPDPTGSYMVSSSVFTQPQGPLLQNQ
jgi:hypothetical protein